MSEDAESAKRNPARQQRVANNQHISDRKHGTGSERNQDSAS